MKTLLYSRGSYTKQVYNIGSINQTNLHIQYIQHRSVTKAFKKTLLKLKCYT